MKRNRKSKKSLNRRALSRIVVLSMVSCAVIASLFYVMEMSHIRQKAEDSLHEFMEQTWLASDEPTPEVFSLGTDEADEEYLMDGERELLSYYIQNQESIPLNEIQYFRDQDYEVYYFAKAAEIRGQEQGDRLLICTDVSFTTNTVRSAVYIMIAVMVLLGVLLHLVSRHTIRVLDAKDQSMKDFFANASHELKTPIMAIKGYSDGLRDGIVTQEKACQVIEKEMERMTALINGILEFSKLDSGIVNPHTAEYDVREILYDAAGVIEVSAGQRGIHISFDMPEPLLYFCDEDMLFSAFSNILTNSIRYAESNIYIEAARQKASDVLKIRIANDGKVIPGEEAEHLFERFYKGTEGQTGIGMALCKEYIELHNGTIMVSAAEDRTVFEICLVHSK